MIINKVSKLKKYLFLISILFLVLFSSHLVYLYLYNDSKLVPIKGGTISEGLIGNFPSLNPLKPLSGNNKYIIDILYKSPLKYDLNENKIVGDLANCDLSNLNSIECYIKDDSKWSSGENITINDIEATYNLIKETNSNKVISSLLQETEIITKNDKIIFKNSSQDINFLNIFFQPIISKETIDTLSQENIYGNFPTTEQIYSGEFVISNISSDLTLGFSKIILDRNEFNKKGNISKLILKIFPNTGSFLKNKESVNIFNDNDNIIGGSIPRLEAFKYTLPQFVGVFLNQENIENKDLRNIILNNINTDDLIELIGSENFNKVNNPYLTDINANKAITSKNIDSIMKSEGYTKKSEIINTFSSPSKKYSNEATIEIKDEEINIDDFQEKSKYIKSPSYVEKYNFITKDNILLIGNTPTTVENIYINDYKLSNFKKGNSEFYYRLKESYESIKQGENSYKIYFEENGEKTLKEELNFIYYTDKTKLEEEETKFIKNLVLEKKKSEIKKVEKVEVNKDDLEKFSKLDDNLYYNNNYEAYSIKLVYINSTVELEQSARFIQESLNKIGIDVELIPIGINNLRKILSDKSQYDLILTGVNLGYFNFNIFPYFHSSQSKNGYNFSNIKRTSLDLKLEELKSNGLNNNNLKNIESEVISILKEEQIIKTLYTPKISLLVDKNLKNIEIPEVLPNKSLRSIVLNSSYIKEEKIINFENKNIKNFFYFLYNKINE